MSSVLSATGWWIILTWKFSTLKFMGKSSSRNRRWVQMRSYKSPCNSHFTSKAHSLSASSNFMKKLVICSSKYADIFRDHVCHIPDAMEGSCPLMRVRLFGVSKKVGLITFALPPLRPWPLSSPWQMRGPLSPWVIFLTLTPNYWVTPTLLFITPA